MHFIFYIIYTSCANLVSGHKQQFRYSIIIVVKESIMASTARQDLKLLSRIRAQVKKTEISPTYKFIKKTWCSLHNVKTLGFLIAMLCWCWKYLNLKCSESSKLNKTGFFSEIKQGLFNKSVHERNASLYSIEC